MTSQSRLDIVVGALNMASAELKKIQGDIGALETKGTKAGLSIGQAWQKGGLLIASATGALYAANKAIDATVGEAERLIASTDDIADRFGVTVKEAGALLNVTRTLGISESALGLAFKTMAQHDIPPTLDGLLQVKTILDATASESERTALTVKLMGRSGLELAETLRLDRNELKGYIDRARGASVVTEAMTDAQDEFNRSLAEGKNLQNAANLLAMQSGIVTKNAVVLAWQEAMARGAATSALRAQGIETRGLNLTTQEMINVGSAAVDLERRGISVRGMGVQAVMALAAAMGQAADAAREANPELADHRLQIQGIASAWASVPATVSTSYDVKLPIKGILRDVDELARQLGISRKAAYMLLTGKSTGLSPGGTPYIPVAKEDRSSLTGEGRRGEQQAAGGPLAPLAIVGEQGWETVVRTPHGFVVVPHDESVALARLGILTGAPSMALGGEVESGGTIGGGKTWGGEQSKTSTGGPYLLGDSDPSRFTGSGTKTAAFGIAGGTSQQVASAIDQTARASAMGAAAAAAASVTAATSIFASEIPAAVSAQTESQMREQRRSNDALARELGLVRREIRRQTKAISGAFRDQIQQVL